MRYVLAAVLLLTAGAVQAGIINVPGDYLTIQAAIAAAADNDTIQVATGTFVETGQIDINKSLAIIGAGAGNTVIKPASDTDSSNSKTGAWIYVNAGKTVKLARLSLDGSGRLIHHAVQSYGSLTVEDCDIRNIGRSTYLGRGIVFFGGTSNAVRRCTFSGIQRIGVHVRGNMGAGNPAGTIEDCTYTGKGPGDWLDYAFEMGGGGQGTVLNCRVSGCLGVALSDGSTSAGIVATDYFGAGTKVLVTGSDIRGCSEGVAVGYGTGDSTAATVVNCNLTGNGTGIQNVATVPVNAKSNWWGSASGPGPVGPGSGDRVSANVDYAPWRTTPVPRVMVLKDDKAAAANILTNPSDRAAGAGSWQANGTSKAELYLTPQQLFGRSITVRELAGIAYQTKKSTDGSGVDWYINIYTVGTTQGWYGERLTLEPMYSHSLNAPANQWNLWSTDTGTNQLTLFDGNHTNKGFYYGPTLAEVTAGPINWANYPNSGGDAIIDYASQDVKYIVLATGNPWCAGFTGLVDDLNLRLKTGESALVDLESDGASDALWLDVSPATRFVKPDDAVEVALNMSSLSGAAAGYQAFMSFDTGKLSITAADIAPTPSPFGLNWWKVLSEPNIDLAAGIDNAAGQKPTAAEARLAELTFAGGSSEGLTQVSFRVNDPPTLLADANGDAIVPTTLDSQVILVDGTPPEGATITASTNNWTKDPITFTFSATDALTGIDHYELSIPWISSGAFFTATSTYLASVAGVTTGAYPVTVKAFDRAGNSATASTTVKVDNTNPVLTDLRAWQGGTEVFSTGGSVRATITKTDGADAVTFTIAISDTGPHYGAGMAFATNTTAPAFQVYFAEFSDNQWHFQDYGTGWNGTDTTTLPPGFAATGNGSGQTFTITVPYSALGGTGSIYHWAAQARTNLLGSYPAGWSWGSPVSGYASSIGGYRDVLNGVNNALQGAVNISVNATDADSGLAGPPAVTVVHTDGGTTLPATLVDPLGPVYGWTLSIGPATINGRYSITVTGTDNVGNSASATGYIIVNKTEAIVTVQLEGLSVAAVTRTIKFVIGGTGGTVAPVPVDKQVTFAAGTATTTLTNLPTAQWTNISAKDEQHTLRQLVSLSTTGSGQYSASFTGDDQLIGGDLTNDNLVDIRDFGVFAGQYGTSPPLNTQWPAKNANISCDGYVDTNDFSYIQIHFLAKGDAEPGAAQTAGLEMPMTSISVKELAKMVGMRAARKADVNNDGVVDTTDMKLFMDKHPRVKR